MISLAAPPNSSRDNPMLGIAVYHPQLHQQSIHADERVQLGSARDASNTLVIRSDDFSPQQCVFQRAETDAATKIQITNLGRTMVRPGGQRLYQGAACRAELPVTLRIGQTIIRVFDPCRLCAADESLNYLSETGQHSAGGQLLPESLGAAPSATTLSEWFHCLSSLQNIVDGPQSFLNSAARAVIDPGGMDAGMIILKQDKQWAIEASFVPQPDIEISFRQDLLERVEQSGQTLFHDSNELNQSKFDKQQSAVVASPVFDQQNRVVGAVYGIRRQHQDNLRRGVRPLEAYFIQLIADAVTAAQARAEKEQQIAEGAALLQSAFPSQIALQLQRDPSALHGTAREVTALFADLQQFSRLAEQLDPKLTYQIIGDVMNCWSAVVDRHNGVIIDFYGDGLAAFWNAPIDMPDHPRIAVACAIELQQTMQRINADWAELVGRAMRCRIGIATGRALVGNCGSSTRLKYGPHGPTVNLASRLESISKRAQIPILISHETASQIGEDFIVQRIASFKIRGFQKPVDVYQPLDPIQSDDPMQRGATFQEALRLYERQEFKQAAEFIQAVPPWSEMDGAVEFLKNLIRKRVPCPIDLTSSINPLDDPQSFAIDQR